jgi:oligopeptide/dipeptide ABC transporter ATP-binding protein
MSSAESPLLEVRDLHTYFPTRTGVVKAVEGVSLQIQKGEVLGVVGESGCGKSITALSIVRLLQAPGRIVSGSILFDGIELSTASDAALQQIRGDRIGMVFQDPMTALNPAFRVGWQVAEPLRLHRGASRADAGRRAVSLLAGVGIPRASERARSYPHEFSGGMRQRALIASALATSPALLIADEPTTALDVTVQAQILDLLREASITSGTSMMLITHNLGVVAGMCDRVIVMYAGRVVETGTTEEVLIRPKHPYTLGLLRSLPRLDDPGKAALRAIEGSPPDPTHKPSGCPFHPRCSFRLDKCVTEVPPITPVEPTREVACWYTTEVGDPA